MYCREADTLRIVGSRRDGLCLQLDPGESNAPASNACEGAPHLPWGVTVLHRSRDIGQRAMKRPAQTELADPNHRPRQVHAILCTAFVRK
jgi:hypothetical protein